MSKACQYATNDEKVINDLKHVSVKATQGSVQEMFTWTKSLGKGRQKWEKACVENGLWLHKLQTPKKMRFARKLIMFDETLQFKKL